MRFKQNGNKRDIVAMAIYNDEASATIGLGNAVVLSLSGTQDGVAVVLPSTAGDTKQSTFGYGVSLGSYAPKAFGEAQVFGLCSNVMLLRTRAASTDVFASVISGLLLRPESVSNAFVTVASNGASAFTPVAALAFNVPAIASTLASSVNTTTTQVVGFLRMM